METATLPNRDEMITAFQQRDSSYEGIFVTGVRSTGIFCRIGCPARTPRTNQLEFFATPREALFAGFRPCKRCRPLEPLDTPPLWLRTLLDAIEQDPECRWTDSDIRALQLQPDRVRRWFQRTHGMTFHSYARARRLGMALTEIRKGSSVIEAAFDHGYDSISGFNEAFRLMLGTNPKAASNGAMIRLARISTPLGPMIACATDDALCMLEFSDRRMLVTQFRRIQKYLGGVMIPGNNRIIEQLTRELDDYFAGKRKQFTVPMHAPGTPFQETVWAHLQRVAYGVTSSYAELARDIGRPRAVRAVARANGDNRIAILIPCHRIIGSDGQLTGYGGGLWRKKRLLEIES